MPQIANQDYFLFETSNSNLSKEEKKLLLSKIKEGTILDVVFHYIAPPGEPVSEFWGKVIGYGFEEVSSDMVLRKVWTIYISGAELEIDEKDLT